MSKFGAVRSLRRGLEVLEAVNHYSGLRASKVARIIGIPRPRRTDCWRHSKAWASSYGDRRRTAGHRP